MNEIVKKSVELSQDQYGNYVIQHILEFGKDEQKQIILKSVNQAVLTLSQQKYSSNVIEKCFQFASDKDKAQLILTMIGKPTDINPPLYSMMKDKFANYVVQKAVEVSQSPVREMLIAKIKAMPDPNNYCKECDNTMNSYACI